MSRLAIYGEEGGRVETLLRDHDEIARRLAPLGVRFERWETRVPLAQDAQQEEVLAAYHASVERLSTEYGFKSMDVVSLTPDHPSRAELRRKFLDEHTHDDFEVRFFVGGSGLFYLHMGSKVYGLLCEEGDLVSVPAHTLHWFDMGERPAFKCIRLFTISEGWVGHTSGSDIANKFPSYDAFVESHA